MAAKPDLTEFLKLSRPRKPLCRVGLASGQLTEPERAQLEAALATDPGLITHAAIRQWLSLRGLDVSVSGLTNHRVNLNCTCHDD